MDHDANTGLFKRIVGYLAGLPPERSTTPRSVKSQAHDAWLRTDAYLQCETQDFDDLDPQQEANALRALNNLVQFQHNEDLNVSFNRNSPYPKLQAVRSILQQADKSADRASNPAIRLSKRKRDQAAVIEEFQCLDAQAKRRRLSPRGDPDADDDTDAPEADFAILARKRSLSLYQGLRTHWTCVCQKCSRLSVGLSLPPQRNGSPLETCFEVFFGVQSVVQVSLQEARITVKDEGIERPERGVEIAASALCDFVHLCQTITESLDQQNCLNLRFENGLFKRLRPQPKVFGDSHHLQTVSLSALFKRQQELSGGTSVLPQMGKRILAVVLATALLPFLETPWVQPTFNHSNIQFFQPSGEGDLPDITKPFLDMKKVPIAMASRVAARDNQAESDSAKHMIHPNASVLALGVLLCELHYCRPIESWQDHPETSHNVNSDYYNALEALKDLEVDAGIDYYLATKACLRWEYLPAGEMAAFESASVQKLFYRNVVKRLESEISKTWDTGLEKLQRFNDQDKQRCWGRNGSEVVRQYTARRVSATIPVQEAPAISLSPGPTAIAMVNNSAQASSFLHGSHPVETSPNLQFFDAAHQMASAQDTALSDRWMDSLLMSIYQYVDPYEAFIEPSVGLLNPSSTFRPVRIAILDSGFDYKHPLIRTAEGGLDRRIKAFQNFVLGGDNMEFHDEIGHGTHTLGLLLKVATCAEIYIARVAKGATLGRDSYDAISKAIKHAVSEWEVDIISMSFGIREYNEDIKKEVLNARQKKTLMFAAASNDGANYGRAFPAKDRGVFCIHSADGNGNPSGFNPTAEDDDANFCLLGENVQSHWPAGKNGHNDYVHVLSGTSVATPIAAGLAASLLSLIRQQEKNLTDDIPRLGSWLKDFDSMDAVFRSVTKDKRGAGYRYIKPHLLHCLGTSRTDVYNKIKELKDHMYQ